MQGRFSVIQTLVFSILCSVSSFTNCHAGAEAGTDSYYQVLPKPLSRFEQRKLYQDLLYLINSNQHSKYLAREARLVGYPLYPYLEYTVKINRISSQSESSITSFVTQHQDTPLANRLLQIWLHSLARRGHWKTLLENYQTAGSTVINKCYYAFALHKHDRQEEALTLAKELWSVGFSQPEACNSIFKLWRDAGNLTSNLAWQRYAMALTSGNQSLSSYLAGFLSTDDQALSAGFRLAHSKPTYITKTDRYAQKGANARLVIAHGLKRLARKDPTTALDTLNLYIASHEFTEDELSDVYSYIAVRLAKKPQTIQHLDRIPIAMDNNTEFVEARIRTALKQLNWGDALVHIHQLPDKTQNTNRWQYWKARILAASIDPLDQQSAAEIYQSVAKNRSFYSFMAADILDQEYEFQDEPVSVSNQEIVAMEESPGFQRSLELLTLGDLTPARREWNFTTRNFSPGELQIAARVAQKWGWHKQTIQAMIAAQAWNDLDVRFPLAYQDSFLSGARRADIPVIWSFAVARQESAFMPDALSSAGALGVMQLMPTTAISAANREGFSIPSKLDLANPYTNIRIGSAYLGQMLRRFDHNRILASAAYNAGPSRVESWLDDSIPLDVWVETIPFRETRSYVTNVLLFSAIYGRKLNQDSPLIYAHELQKFSNQQITSILTPLNNTEAVNTNSTMLNLETGF